MSAVETQIAWLRERGLRVGKNLNLQREVIIDDNHCWHIEIGDDVTIAPRVYILAHDASTKIHLGFTRVAPVKIGSRVFIGAHAIILPGTTIGDDCIIGAGSVVSRDIPAGMIAAGNPAKVIGSVAGFLERRRNELAASPQFGPDFTAENALTEEKKHLMRQRMNGGSGYVV